MPVKVLAFAGSPRRFGNSETLLDWTLASMAERAGRPIEKVPLTEANINPCQGCNACEKLNKCIQNDGMDTYHDKIVEADCIVLSSPIYCMGLCSQVKALVDRAQVSRPVNMSSNCRLYRQRKGKRLGVFLATAGRTGRMFLMRQCPRSSAFIT